MEAKDEIREQVGAISWWLADENKEARRELAERRPELEAWLSMVQKKVQEKLAEIEARDVAVKV